MKKTALLFLLFLLFAIPSIAQADKFSGTWAMEGNDSINLSSFYVALQIAEGEQQTLYPAQLTIRYENFNAVYQLLLVKKNDGQLAIGRNKYAVEETPFSMGTWTILLNGTFDYNLGIEGNAFLSANRIPSKRYGIPLPAMSNYTEENRSTAIHISDLFKKVPIHLKKINQQPWQNAAVNKILHSYDAPIYFGLTDTLRTKTGTASINFLETNKSDNDSISVMFNGKMLIDKMDINKANNSEEIKLDTGLNILCLFADNYGRVPPNTAKLNIIFSEKKYTLDFTTKENLSATFMVAKIYYYPEQNKNNSNDVIARRIITEKINKRQTILIDSIKAVDREITLALWDDALEDGDSISLKINDDIYLPGIAVKKKPQFIKVNLHPGQNNIIFMADNLGSISPNTSVLEIIDGKRRRSYMINTNLGQNNSIKILYDFKP